MLDACFLFCSVKVLVIAGMFIFLICFAYFSAVFGICHLYASCQVDVLPHNLRMFRVSVLCNSCSVLVISLGNFLLCAPVSPGYFPDRSWVVSTCFSMFLICFLYLACAAPCPAFRHEYMTHICTHKYVCIYMGVHQGKVGTRCLDGDHSER